jgi:hypothetical protein
MKIALNILSKSGTSAFNLCYSIKAQLREIIMINFTFGVPVKKHACPLGLGCWPPLLFCFPWRPRSSIPPRQPIILFMQA